MSRKSFTFAFGAVALGSALVLSGCSSSDGADTAVDETVVQQTPEVDVPAQDLVLTAAELPSGFEAIELPEGAMEDAFDELVDGTEGMEVEPAQCSNPNPLPDDIDFNEVGMIVASSGGAAAAATGGTIFAEVVMPGAQSLDEMVESVSGECSTLTMRGTPAGSPEEVSTSATFTEIDAPDTSADEVFAVRQDTTTEVSGQSVDTVTLAGYATVNGYSVSVQFTGTDPDEASFNEAFAAAVDKVADHT